MIGCVFLNVNFIAVVAAPTKMSEAVPLAGLLSFTCGVVDSVVFFPPRFSGFDDSRKGTVSYYLRGFTKGK